MSRAKPRSKGKKRPGAPVPAAAARPVRRRPRAVFGIAAAVVILAAAGYFLTRRARKGGVELEAASAHNVLLITLDTTRADHLGCYGKEGAGTRHLDDLAASGVRFANAVAQAIREKGKPKRTPDGKLVKDQAGNTIFEPGRFHECRAVGWVIPEYGRAQVSINLTN